MRALGKRLHPQRIRRTLGAGSCTQEPFRFAAAELRDRPAEAGYRLRGSSLTARVRHPLLDMWALEEVFRFRAYDPPPEATAALRGLGRPPRVLDLGGHIGYFGLFARMLYPDARVTSFEPDPANAAVLSRCIAANGLEDRWELVQACAATGDGEVEFASDYHLSRVLGDATEGIDEMHRRIGAAFPFLEQTALLTTERRRVAARDVFGFLADADFVKMDIEGGEWPLLADARLADLTAAAVVLEYHPVYATGPDPEGQVASALRGAGYATAAPERSHDAGVIWAWREDGLSS